MDDFEVLGILGRGAFATVYLARQLSLDRQVALKVSPDRGHEARTLAGLEHDHIVHVFAESRDQTRNLSLLCMQLVPGATLEQVIEALATLPPHAWSGRSVLEAIDRLAILPAPFDPAALRDRDVLARCDFVEAVCWLGARLAEALAHAHGRGVLHRDIKPANILLTRYGRPLLADFNVAFDTQRQRGRAGELLGGTLAYMAPEHLDAFNPRTDTPSEAVDERADIYSLGVVLFELLTGRLPFASAAGRRSDDGLARALETMAAERRAQAPPWPISSEVPETLQRAVYRCLAPRPEERYQRVAEVAGALEGCCQLHRMHKELPAGGWLNRACLRHPFAALAMLVVLPHLLGSAVNISYNTLRIVNDLTHSQQTVFAQLVLVYNLVAYPVCVLLLGCMVMPVLRVWRQLSRRSGERPPVEEARRRVLRWPLLTVGLSCAGWLPGAILFPLLLHTWAGPLPPQVCGHFLLSFTMSGLIATTYSLFAMQYVTLRCLYPRLWIDVQGVTDRAAELGSLDRRLGFFRLTAGLIPLLGAILMIEVGPEELIRSGVRTFRVLLTALIVLGMVGFGVTLAVSRRLHEILAVLSGGRGSER